MTLWPPYCVVSLKARGYYHAHKWDENSVFVPSVYNYYNNVNSYCNQHPKRDDLICNEI